ncbi:MAG: peptidase M22 [Opitutaceae bacterium]|nr:peptidase M22 [Opitutaceae bacterium]
MPSLVQLLALHRHLLVLDASSTVIQVGLLRADAHPVWRHAQTDANQGLFTQAAACLAEGGGRSMAEIEAFVFCEGPGSMLGVRTAAMAIRAWQAVAESPRPAYRYQSLTVVAHELVRRGEAAPFAVIADARRDLWHLVEVGPDLNPQPLKRVPAEELALFPGPVWTPKTFKLWSQPPLETRPHEYDLPTLLAALPDKELFVLADAPDAFQHDAPAYKKWSPQIHRAATRSTPTH